MAFTSEKTGRLIFLAALAAGAAWSAQVRFEVRHDHLRKACAGVMTVDDRGIYFRGSKNHLWAWQYGDIQELKLGRDQIHLLTYWDNGRRLGADHVYDFTGKIPDELYAIWKDRLDSRFVAALADPRVAPLWELPVKHLGRIKGSEGVLIFAEDRIVYRTGTPHDSRTWRLPDIDNISKTGPYDLSITTFEQAKFHAMDRREFRFQLKQVLSEARYNDHWRKLNDSKGRTQ
jgi:hypothetical protein